MDSEAVIEQTRRWIADMVIGLNLCPFARRVFDGNLIRFAVTDVTNAHDLRDVLTAELRTLAATPTEQVETSILIHPHTLADFLDYNDFLADAESLIAELGLEGVIQIASFHPRYQFAGTKADAVDNYTNRSPHPMLHVLREDSISKVNDDLAKLADIPQRNIATLRRLGLAKVLEMLGERGT